MNRRDRRRLAREVAHRQGLKGEEKQRVSRLVAKQLPGGSMEATPEQLEAAKDRRRGSIWTPPETGLVVPE